MRPFFVTELWPEEEVILNNRLQMSIILAVVVSYQGGLLFHSPAFSLCSGYRIIFRTEAV